MISKPKPHPITTRSDEMLPAQGVFTSVGPFDVVVIDPPWPVRKIARKARPNQVAFDYPVMTVDQIEEFWPREIAPKLAPDCHVFCWTTQKYLPTVGLRLVEAWSLEYEFVMVWHKP